ncbi:MAG TPA: S41 family peptidase, partial [Bacteroidales bacterium]|nr:S41 family peptidase [Bacteroidales bacterium]
MKLKKFIIVLAGLSILISFPGYGQITEQTLKFGEVLNDISRYYVDTVNEEQLVSKTLRQMLHDLDPHSTYMSKEEVKAAQEQLEGGFEGIGVSFNILDDTIFVVNPIAGGPSEKVGIHAGDRIVKIDGENVAGVGITNLDVMKKLKGPKGTKVNVSIQRRRVDKLLPFTITRDEIPIYSLDASYMVGDDVGYIKLARFSNTTMDEFSGAMTKLQDQGMKDLILDLTGNGGGYLYVAIDLADQFLAGRRMIVYTKGVHNPRKNYYSTDKGSFETGKLIIMIDETSASASEIVSGAMQDWDRAVLVGRRSFGKGLVQGRFELNDGSEIRLTVARYFTPAGRLIQKSYSKGYEAYSHELLERYNSGELSGEDTKHFPDSLKFHTLIKNRVVYGGGGILPDYLVPIDTSEYSDYYRDIISQGVLNQFILEYVDNNRKSLKSSYPDFQTFKKNFSVTPAIVAQLRKY